MRLREWLKREGITEGELGARIKRSQSAVHRYATGERMPRPEDVQSMERATGGEVTWEDHAAAYREYQAKKAAA